MVGSTTFPHIAVSGQCPSSRRYARRGATGLHFNVWALFVNLTGWGLRETYVQDALGLLRCHIAQRAHDLALHRQGVFRDMTAKYVEFA